MPTPIHGSYINCSRIARVMSVTAKDLLRAAEAVSRYAMTTQIPTPMPAEDLVSKMRMGFLYDHWIRNVLRDNNETSNALSSVSLASKESKHAADHFNRMCAVATGRFERVLDYHHPYSPTSNPDGLVTTQQRFDQISIRSVHRAIVMQYLAIYMARLQYMMLLTQIDNSENPELLDSEFFSRMQNIMITIQTTIKGKDFMPSNNTVELHQQFLFDDILALIDQSDQHDISISSQQTLHSDMYDINCIFARLIQRKGQDIPIIFPSDDEPTLVTNSLAKNLSERLVGQINQDEGEEENTCDPHATEVSLSSKALEEQHFWRTAEMRPTTSDRADKCMWTWTLIAGELQDTIMNLNNENSFRQLTTQQIRDASQQRYFVRKTNEIMKKGAPVLARFAAHQAVHQSTRIIDFNMEEMKTELASHMDDCSSLIRLSYTKARLDSYAFIPARFDDRTYLHQIMSEAVALSSLPVAESIVVPGTYVYSASTIRPRTTPTRLWRHTFASTHIDNVPQSCLWTHTHCESALMADIYSIMKGVILANHEATSNRAYPVNSLGFLAQSMVLLPTTPTYIRPDDITASRLKQNASIEHSPAVHNVVSQIHPFPTAQFDTLKQSCKAIRKFESDHPVSTPMGTTQPMPDTLTAWLNAMETKMDIPDFRNVWETEDTATKYDIYRPPMRPPVLNCDPVYSTTQQRLPAKSTPDTSEALSWIQSEEMEAVFLMCTRRHESYTNSAFLSQFTRTRAWLEHGIPAVLALMCACPYGPPHDPFTSRNKTSITLSSQQSTEENEETLFFHLGDRQLEGGYEDLTPGIAQMGYVTRHIIRWAYQYTDINTTVDNPVLNLSKLKDKILETQSTWRNHFQTLPPPFKFPGLWMIGPPITDGEIDKQWKPVEPNERIEGKIIQINVAPPRSDTTRPRTRIHKTIQKHFDIHNAVPSFNPVEHEEMFEFGGPVANAHPSSTTTISTLTIKNQNLKKHNETLESQRSSKDSDIERLKYQLNTIQQATDSTALIYGLSSALVPSQNANTATLNVTNALIQELVTRFATTPTQPTPITNAGPANVQTVAPQLAGIYAPLTIPEHIREAQERALQAVAHSNDVLQETSDKFWEHEEKRKQHEAFLSEAPQQRDQSQSQEDTHETHHNRRQSHPPPTTRQVHGKEGRTAYEQLREPRLSTGFDERAPPKTSSSTIDTSRRDKPSGTGIKPQSEIRRTPGTTTRQRTQPNTESSAQTQADTTLHHSKQGHEVESTAIPPPTVFPIQRAGTAASQTRSNTTHETGKDKIITAVEEAREYTTKFMNKSRLLVNEVKYIDIDQKDTTNEADTIRQENITDKKLMEFLDNYLGSMASLDNIVIQFNFWEFRMNKLLQNNNQTAEDHATRRIDEFERVRVTTHQHIADLRRKIVRLFQNHNKDSAFFHKSLEMLEILYCTVLNYNYYQIPVQEYMDGTNGKFTEMRETIDLFIFLNNHLQKNNESVNRDFLLLPNPDSEIEQDLFTLTKETKNKSLKNEHDHRQQTKDIENMYGMELNYYKRKNPIPREEIHRRLTNITKSTINRTFKSAPLKTELDTFFKRISELTEEILNTAGNEYLYHTKLTTAEHVRPIILGVFQALFETFFSEIDLFLVSSYIFGNGGSDTSDAHDKETTRLSVIKGFSHTDITTLKETIELTFCESHIIYLKSVSSSQESIIAHRPRQPTSVPHVRQMFILFTTVQRVKYIQRLSHILPLEYTTLHMQKRETNRLTLTELAALCPEERNNLLYVKKIYNTAQKTMIMNTFLTEFDSRWRSDITKKTYGTIPTPKHLVVTSIPDGTRPDIQPVTSNDDTLGGKSDSRYPRETRSLMDEHTVDAASKDNQHVKTAAETLTKSATDTPRSAAHSSKQSTDVASGTDRSSAAKTGTLTKPALSILTTKPEKKIRKKPLLTFKEDKTEIAEDASSSAASDDGSEQADDTDTKTFTEPPSKMLPLPKVISDKKTSTINTDSDEFQDASTHLPATTDAPPALPAAPPAASDAPPAHPAAADAATGPPLP